MSREKDDRWSRMPRADMLELLGKERIQRIA